ncbi:AAA family ATPase [Mycolicibacterium vaccae]|uniref:AAA family ATPase n=1 Tax=Mycolicibacterium vaccae TaxID=1810 RepID=UPI003D008F0B
MTIRTRKPTGVPPWPLVLIEGPEKSGKSWAAAEFTASDKIGQAYWLDLGEGAADEYAAIPGAKYLIVDHDGTWHDIIAQVEQIHAVAAEAQQAGEPPVVLIIDSMTTEWEQLKDWTSKRARESRYAKQKLREDPNAEVKPSMNLWNDAADRHQRLMRLLMTFPGIAIMTARGKETAALDADGKPIERARDYRVEGHKNLPFDASIWVRLSRDEHPQVIGCRSVKAGVRPGVDRPLKRPDLTLEWVILDVLGLDPLRTDRRQLTALVSDEAELANAARRELAEFIRARKLKYTPIAERFYIEREEKLEDTTDPEAIRKLLAALKAENPENPEGERLVDDACFVLGLDVNAVKGRFIAQHKVPPRQAAPEVVQQFCDRLHDEAAQAEARDIDAAKAAS